MNHPCVGFTLTLATAAAVIAVGGGQVLLGFVLGVIITCVTAAICAADLE